MTATPALGTVTPVAMRDGVAYVDVQGTDSREFRAAARRAACKLAGTVALATPIVDRRGRGVTRYGFAVVTTTRPAATPVAPAKATPKATPAPKATPVAPSLEDRVAALESAVAHLAQAMTALTTTAVATPAPKAPKAPKAPRVIPPQVQARIAASHAVTCKSCRDLGVVRGVGNAKGQPYRTADGAAAATAAGRSVPCPSHTARTA